MSEKIATRAAYGETLAVMGSDERIVVLDADLSKSTKTDMFQKKFPDRHINMGIAESNMMSVAAGLASCGKIVFASSFAMFAAGRAYEQVRNSIGYPRLNVKIGATHAGISVGEDGASHQAIEDIALMRAIPGMTVISPSDAYCTSFAVKAAIEHEGPVYLRLGRLAVPLVHQENTKFELGKGVTMKDGSDVSIIANGLMVQYALKAASLLESEGFHARVIDMHTIKPIDRGIIINAAKETGCIVTAEEHTIVGGLGSAVAEVVSDSYPVPVKMVGIQDDFGKSGNPYELLERYGLTAKEIVKKAYEAMQML